MYVKVEFFKNVNTVLFQPYQFYTLVVNMKRVNVSITDKYKALQKIAEGSCTKKKIAEQYGVKKNTVSKLKDFH